MFRYRDVAVPRLHWDAAHLVGLDGQNTVPSCAPGVKCGYCGVLRVGDTCLRTGVLFGHLSAGRDAGHHRLDGQKQKKNRYCYSPAKSWLRYGVLAVFVVAMIAGIGSLVALLAPYSSYGRIASNLFTPLYVWGNNLLAYFAERADSYAFYETEVWLKSLPTFLIALLSFIIIGVLAWRNGRTYCNTVCPVGTVLGLLARFSWLKPVIDTDKCVNCKLCTRNCKAACIDIAKHRIDYSRCVTCLDCISKCHKGAISYKHPTKKEATQPIINTSKISTDQINDTRRSFLTVATTIATTGILKAQEKK